MGTDAIHAALVAVGTLDTPTTIRAHERAVLSLEDRAPEALHVALVRSMEQVISTLIEGAAVRPTAATLVLGSPLAASRMAQSARAWDHDESITDAVLKQLAGEALGLVGDLPREDIFEASVIRVELNGYPTTAPEGQRAHECLVSVLASATSPRLRSDLVAAILRSIPALDIRVRTGTRALITIALESERAPRDYMAVDMGGEGASAFVVRKGVLTQQERIDIGERAILARVSSTGLPEETLSLISMAAKDQCGDLACTDTTQALAKAEPELARVYGELFARFATPRRVPTTLLLLARPELAPWLQHFFARIDFAQFTVTGRPFEVRVLDAAQFDRWVSVDSTVETHLALASALVHIEERDER